MKYSSIYKKISCTDEDDVFEYLTARLRESITAWDYFVDWKKVFGNLNDLEINLNLLNYLIGKDNFEQELRTLLKKYPAVQTVFPIMLACRECNIKILTSTGDEALVYEDHSFSSKIDSTDPQIDKVVRFVQNTGLAELFVGKKIKNVVDYVIGVEVGLDSNGRKNRGGFQMENIVKLLLEKICKKNGFKMVSDANQIKIKNDLGVVVPIDKSSRRYDFAIHTGKRIYLLETNFYGGSGSKLKATAGEYQGLSQFLINKGYGFIWVTDGLGWESTIKPLREAFNVIDHVMNLSMVEEGILEDILRNNL